jgi:hypothetical protein
MRTGSERRAMFESPFPGFVMGGLLGWGAIYTHSLLSGYKIPVFSMLQEGRQADLDCHLLQALQNGFPMS